MKLITYYGLLEPKTVYRVVMEGGAIQGGVQQPGDARWHRSGSVVYQINETGAAEITAEDARAIITAWGGNLDENDYYNTAFDPTEIENSDEFAFDEFEPVEYNTSSRFPVAAMVPPGQDRSVAHFDPDFDLWGIPSQVHPGAQTPTFEMTPPSAPARTISPEIEALFSAEELEFLAAFEGGLLVVNGEEIADTVDEPAMAMAEAPVAEILEPRMIPSPPPPPVNIPVFMFEEKGEENPQMARKDAMAALREIVDGLSDLGRAGMSWA